jgi:hypothetical protein
MKGVPTVALVIIFGRELSNFRFLSITYFHPLLLKAKSALTCLARKAWLAVCLLLRSLCNSPGCLFFPTDILYFRERSATLRTLDRPAKTLSRRKRVPGCVANSSFFWGSSGRAFIFLLVFS